MRKAETQAMQTFEQTMKGTVKKFYSKINYYYQNMKLFLINEKALNKLDSINIEQKLGIDTKAKYAE